MDLLRAGVPVVVRQLYPKTIHAGNTFTGLVCPLQRGCGVLSSQRQVKKQAVEDRDRYRRLACLACSQHLHH